MSERPRLQSVLLDLDGTLLQSDVFDVLTMDRLLREALGLELPEAEIRRFLGRSSRDILSELSPGRVEPLLARLAELGEELRHLSQPFPGILEKLKQAGLRLGVVTSQNRRELAASRRHAGLDGLIDVWIAADDVPRPKPASDPIIAALAALRTAPAAAVMVGDTRFDIEAGRAAGTLTAAACWGASDPEALSAQKPDYLLAEPEDLLCLRADGARDPGREGQEAPLFSTKRKERE